MEFFITIIIIIVPRYVYSNNTYWSFIIYWFKNTYIIYSFSLFWSLLLLLLKTLIIIGNGIKLLLYCKIFCKAWRAKHANLHKRWSFAPRSIYFRNSNVFIRVQQTLFYFESVFNSTRLLGIICTTWSHHIHQHTL